MDMIPGPGG